MNFLNLQNKFKISLRITFYVGLILGLQGLIFHQLAYARNISFIRDTEIENTIRLYAQGIFKAANLDSTAVNVYIINDDNLNAFVTNGQKIFMNSGTLRYADTPEEVMGVIAHEAGHITGGHMAKLYDQLDKAKAITIASLFLGVPLAIASGRADIATAATAFGMTTAERGFLAYSRENEQSADNAGIDFMNKAGIDPSGLVDFMARIEKKSKLYQGGTPDPYVMTHPLTSERIQFLENQREISPNRGKKLPNYFYVLHDRMRAKLNGFLDPPEQTLRAYPKSDTSMLGYYARTIAYMQSAKWQEAQAEMDQLLVLLPNDPFIIELNGDLNHKAGNLEVARQAYTKAIEILPWAGLIRIALASVLIDMKDSSLEEEAIANLSAAKSYEQDNSSLWRNLGLIYERRKDPAMLALVSAESAIRTNDLRRALSQADIAVNQLPRNSSAWQRARDIYNQANIEINAAENR